MSTTQSPERPTESQPITPGEHQSKSLTPAILHQDLPAFTFPLQSCLKPTRKKGIMSFPPTKNVTAAPRFFHLLQQSEALVGSHGVHTSYMGTTVFSRAPVAPVMTQVATTKQLALSLAAAEDCVGSAQSDGPAQEDPAVFKQLWEVATSILENIFEHGSLDHETFGWGLYGLTTGYVHRTSWRDNSGFLSLQTRLHDGLIQMPDLDKRWSKPTTPTSTGGKAEVLAKARREIHVCANLLLQQFSREDMEENTLVLRSGGCRKVDSASGSVNWVVEREEEIANW